METSDQNLAGRTKVGWGSWAASVLALAAAGAVSYLAGAVAPVAVFTLPPDGGEAEERNMSTWQLGVGLVACILLATCAGGCTSDLDDVEPTRSIPVRTSQFEGVILLPGDWVPTDKEVLALEEQLVAYLIQQRNAFDSLQAPIEERLPTYRRQYWGVLENNKRLIVANFFCGASHTEWTEQVVTVLDGGDCYFRVRYDVEAGTFSDLVVNGSA